MEAKTTREMQAALAKPFAPEDLEWRLQNTNEEKMRGMAVPYVTNRAIQNRLDEVCGPLFWPPYRRRVRRELADHILSRAELLERSTGCPRGQAIERAISAMGDAHSLGLLLRRTRFPLRGLFLTLMTSLIWAAIAACILYLLLHLGLRT